MVVGMETDSRHLVHFLAAPHVFPPVRQLGINGAERDQQIRAVAMAICRQLRVSGRNVFMKYSVESASPRLGHVAFTETGDKISRLISNQSAERPSGQIHIHVDHYAG